MSKLLASLPLLIRGFRGLRKLHPQIQSRLVEAATSRADKPPTAEELIGYAVAEAAQQKLNKETKLSVAEQAIYTQDVQALAGADRAKVAALEEKLLGIKTKATGDDVGDIIVCDDYDASTHHPSQAAKPNGKALPVIAGILGGSVLAAVAATVFWLLLLLLRDKPDPPPVVTINPSPGTGSQAPLVTIQPTPSAFDAVTEERQPDGTWKEIRRERLSPK